MESWLSVGLYREKHGRGRIYCGPHGNNAAIFGLLSLGRERDKEKHTVRLRSPPSTQIAAHGRDSAQAREAARVRSLDWIFNFEFAPFFF